MFQLFLKARANNYFKARSAGRDTETDHARATSIFRSIEDALEGAKAEQAGLKSRIDDALARAAVTLGNDSDEYLTRGPEDNHYQNLLGTEIADGQWRLNELGVTIEHIQFLNTALVTRFPDFKLGTQHFPRERQWIDLRKWAGPLPPITQQRPLIARYAWPVGAALAKPRDCIDDRVSIGRCNETRSLS